MARNLVQSPFEQHAKKRLESPWQFSAGRKAITMAAQRQLQNSRWARVKSRINAR